MAQYDNEGMNESGNFGNGCYAMPTPATGSEADGAIAMAGIISIGATGPAADSGERGSEDSAGVPKGGNIGVWSDGLPTSDAQRGNDSTGRGR